MVVIGSRPGEGGGASKLSSLPDVRLVPVETVDDAIQLLRDKQADGVLLESKTPFDIKKVTDSLCDGITVLDEDLRLLWHNRALEELARGFGTTAAPGERLYDVLRGENAEGPNFCPCGDCFAGAPLSRGRIRTTTGKHLELIVQPLIDDDDPFVRRVVCQVRDVTYEVRDHEKLVAIHRAGLELSHLTPEELAQMSHAERVDLLKANILQYSQKILSFKNLEIRLLDPETRKLTVLLSEGMTDEAGGRELRAELEGHGVTGFVAATAQSYLCDDVLHDPHYLPGARDARSSLTVPIIYRERVIGAFNVESPEPRHFSESDREFLEVFAREIAVALNQLNLLEAEQQHAGSASVDAILTEVSLPVDEIVSDTIQLFDYIHQPIENKEQAHEAIRRVLLNARAVKTSIQKVGRRFDSTPPPIPANEFSLLSGRRVLLADADPAVRRSAHYQFARVGVDVDTARDGQEALRLLRTIRYDCVVGDIRLPDLNGYEFFHQVRAAHPNTPIVLMTGFGYDASHSMVKARQEGLRVILYKPFRLDRLCEAVADAIDPQLQHQRPRLSRPPAAQSIL